MVRKGSSVRVRWRALPSKSLQMTKTLEGRREQNGRQTWRLCAIEGRCRGVPATLDRPSMAIGQPAPRLNRVGEPFLCGEGVGVDRGGSETGYETAAASQSRRWSGAPSEGDQVVVVASGTLPFVHGALELRAQAELAERPIDRSSGGSQSRSSAPWVLRHGPHDTALSRRRRPPGRGGRAARRSTRGRSARARRRRRRAASRPPATPSQRTPNRPSETANTRWPSGANTAAM